MMQSKAEGGMMMVIPSVVLLDEGLPLSARVLYGIITWRCNQDAYTRATNKKLGEDLGVSAKRVSSLLSLLEERGHIQTAIKYKENSKEILYRCIFPVMKSTKERVMAEICADPPPQNEDTPPLKQAYLPVNGGIPLPQNKEVICNNKIEHTGEHTESPPYSPPTGDAPPKKSRRKAARTEPEYRPDWFVRFWALYPRRTARAAAVRAWDKLRPDLDLCRVMTAAIKAQMQTPQWREGPDHIPHPATWLNGARWLDEVAPAPPPDSTGWAPDPEVY